MTPRTAAQWHALVADLLPRAAFDERVGAVRDEFGGLLRTEAAAQVVVDRLGRNPVTSLRLADLAPGLDGIVEAACLGPAEVRTFPRGDGQPGRMAKARLRDASGACDLVLWGEQAERWAPRLAAGVRVRVVNGHVKRARGGGHEVHLGRWAALEFPDAPPDEEARRKLEEDVRGEPASEPAARDAADDDPGAPAPPPPPRPLSLHDASTAPPGEVVTLVGRVAERSATRTFVRDGKVGFVADLVLDDGTARLAVTLWGERTREAQAFDPGAEVAVEDAQARAPRRGGPGVEFHAGERARLRSA